MFAKDENASHEKFNAFHYYATEVKYEGEIFPIYLNVGRAKNNGTYHLYDITKKRDTAGRINGLERPKPNEGIRSENGISSKDSISQPLDKVNANSKIRSKSRTTSEQDSTYLDAVKRGDMETAQRMVDEAVAFYPEQIKSADSVTYDDNGNVIPLFERFNPEKKGIRHKARGVDKYTMEEYNKYGWARANGVLNAKENTKLRYLFADAVSKQSNPPRTKLGEYMIAIGEDVDNKIAYMEGTIDDPKITKVLAIDEYDETQLDKARRNIYDLERRGIQQKTQGVFRLYREADFGSYADFTRNVERDKQNNRQLGIVGGTGSSKTQRIKEILFDDEGNKVSRTVRHKSRSYTAGQVAKIRADLSNEKVYSKIEVMRMIKRISPDLRNRSFESLADEICEKLGLK